MTCAAPLAREPRARPRGSSALLFLDGLPDDRLALVLGSVLFVLAAWPLLLTPVPPFQDLPNHLACASVLLHPAAYPSLVSSGFLRTNAAFFAWLVGLHPVLSLENAARVFTALVLLANALLLPQLVLRFTRDRQKLLTATFLAWPFVHHWFVSMGMMDFCLATAIGLGLLLVLERQSRVPTATSYLWVFLLGAFAWFAHIFPLLVVGLLALVHVASQRSRRERVTQAKRVLLPLLVIVPFVLHSTVTRLFGPPDPSGDPILFQFGFELVAGLWAEGPAGLTWLSAVTLVPALALLYFAVTRRDEPVPFFSKWGLLALLGVYAFAPDSIFNWHYANARIVPFFWFGTLLYVPRRLPRGLTAALAACAVSYSLGLGYDYVRLERDRQDFLAGLDAVPEGASLLPLDFKRSSTSTLTDSLLHAWSFYAIAKQTSVPLLFARVKASRNYDASPIAFREAPPPALAANRLEGFAPRMATEATLRGSLRGAGMSIFDSARSFREEWAAFWNDVRPRFDHILAWEITPEAAALVPPFYRITFQQGALTIYERVEPETQVGAR